MKVLLSRLGATQTLSYFTTRAHSYFSALKDLPHYQLIDSFYSDDYKLTVHQLFHRATGAHIYKFQNDDPDNSFSTIVKTFPSNDKGVPHILEHLACCGSERFPIRDPFFNMMKRSVNSYMNAWTGNDFTAYLFSSPNSKDWRNLYQVYLDLSLNPLLHQLDFYQEGWRYSLKGGSKEFKGIVLNQMKGFYQSPEKWLIIETAKMLLEGTPYSFEYGGLPREIVNLSYQELIAFHQKYYHPSNISFFYYGNRQISSDLQLLHDKYLAGKENRVKQYRHGEHILPLKPKNHIKTIKLTNVLQPCISLSFYLGNMDFIPQVEHMALKILSYMLLEQNQAQAYKQFVDKGIASSIGQSCLHQQKMYIFNLTLDGIKQSYQAWELKKKFIEIMQRLCQQGLAVSRLEEFINQFEISILKPRQTNGINMLDNCLNIMNHRFSNLRDYFQPRENLKKAEELVRDPKRLSQLITKYFLENQHWVVVKQLKDEGVDQVPMRSEVEFSDQRIVENEQLLQKRQSTPQNTDILPKLQLEELEIPKQENAQIVSKSEKFTHYHITINQHLKHYRLALNFKKFSNELLEALDILCYTFNKGIATSKYNPHQLSSKIARLADQIEFSVHLGQQHSLNLLIKTTCLEGKAQQLLELIVHILKEPVFGEDNIHTLFRNYSSDRMMALHNDPIIQCMDQCGASLTIPALLSNCYQQMKDGLLISNRKQIDSLKTASKLLRCYDSLILIEHSKSPSNVQHLHSQLYSPTKYTINQCNLSLNPTYKAVLLQSETNYCSQQYRAPKLMSADQAYLSLLLAILQHDYLHPQIRQKGGAYGAKAIIRSNECTALFSYRDPYSTETFKVFDESIKKILQLEKVDGKKLLQAKLKHMSGLDKPKPPQNQQWNRILMGVSNDQKNQYRRVLLAASSQQVLDAGRKYLTGTKSQCIFGKDTPEGFISEDIRNFTPLG